MKIRNIIMLLIASIILVGTVSAHSEGKCLATLTIPDDDKTVLVGNTVNFTLNLMPDSNGAGSFTWVAPSPLTAKIDPEEFSSSGGVQFNTDNGVLYTRTLTVMANSGVEIGHPYVVTVTYCEWGLPACKDTHIMTTAQGTITPTPELSTAIFTAAGLIGLIGLIKFSKKE